MSSAREWVGVGLVLKRLCGLGHQLDIYAHLKAG